MLFLQSVLRGSLHEDTSPGTKELASTASLPRPSATCGKQHSTKTARLTCMYQALILCAPEGLLFPITLTSVPAQRPLPQKMSTNPCPHRSPNQRVLQALRSGGDGVTSHFISTLEHTQLKFPTFRPGTKRYPQQAKRAHTDD